MHAEAIKRLLEEVASGRRSAEEAFERLRDIPFTDFLGVAKHDSHRAFRNGFQETLLCEGKRLEHIVGIVEKLVEQKKNVLGTRMDEARAQALLERFPTADVDPVSRTFRIIQQPIEPISGRLAILCAGTADIPVAEEARRTAEFFGAEARRHYDVGVAGIHRLLDSLEDLRSADVAIVVAGMEGALPSVFGGLLSVPIVAVPTSVGYGASFEGIAALLGMLSSCSEGITVVNIDNGFGAACAALRILRRLAR
jgi:NCAIR mutase (PurE)-related protein